MYRLHVEGSCYVAADRVSANVEHAKTLGLRVLEDQPTSNAGPLAVVGGGPSVQEHLETLRAWPGAIWGINGTHQWLRSHGIESALFSVDPGDELATLTDGATRAVLASHCDPQVFENLRGVDVTIYHSEHVEGAKKPMIGGTTSATRAPMVALMMGHYPISFFGCEGSFNDKTHSFKHEDHPRQIIIRAGGKDYITTLQFMDQCENLAMLIRNMPDIAKDCSGGLLGAMIEHPETWEVVAFSKALRDEIDPTSTNAYQHEAA